MHKVTEDEIKYTCRKCNGTGMLLTIKRIIEGRVAFDRKSSTKCPMCNGTGWVDWLQNLLRRK